MNGEWKAGVFELDRLHYLLKAKGDFDHNSNRRVEGLFYSAIVLAGFRRIGCGRSSNRPRRKRKKIGKVKDKLMDILHKMIFPVRRVWLSLSARLKHRNDGTGLLKLQDDVQTCGYEDVQVMWEMLQRSETELVDKRKQQPFWRIFVWSNHNHNHK
ncbi:hypothetical protein L6164_004602 [Bauhinia variegata]|uniref:Uncharacterized protein n=1 Tax=Bauhinia variegata TaxID=167791 RepID=A0ACB9Q4Y6_BAUVA|nr:hypothetical protein L6164_004602 [Bauhinia variegata]